LTGTLSALEESVEKYAALLPQKRTACLDASNKWQKLVIVTNAAIHEKSALRCEESTWTKRSTFIRVRLNTLLFSLPTA